MRIDKLILTGLHCSGKSTFLQKLCTENHNISNIRLDINSVKDFVENISINTYINFFNVYDRFLFIEPIICWGDNDYLKILESIFMILKDYYKNSLFIINVNFYKDNLNNSIKIYERYLELYKLLKKLKYNVKLFKTNKDWENFTSNFKQYEFNNIKNSYKKFEDTLITDENLKKYLKLNYPQFSGLLMFSNIFNTLDYLYNISNSFKYTYFIQTQINKIYIPNTVVNIKQLNKYIKENYVF